MSASQTEMALNQDNAALETAQIPQVSSDAVPTEVQTEPVDAPSAPEVQDVDMDAEPEADREKDRETVRGNAIFLTGVDKMTSKDIEKFVTNYYSRPFYMEWIDDHSLNIAYDETEDAYNFLVDITDEKEFDSPDPIAPTQLRLTRPHPNRKFANQRIEARYATLADVKPMDSRKRSEFYKKHGMPSRQEDIVRFGTSRSAPMLYGLDNVDVLPTNGSKDSEDLFPDRAPSRYEADLITGKLYKVSNRGNGGSNGGSSREGSGRSRRGRGGRGRESKSKADEPDLFAHIKDDRGPGGSGVGKRRSRGGRRRRGGAGSKDGDNGANGGANEGTDGGAQQKKEAAAPSAYANMDY